MNLTVKNITSKASFYLPLSAAEIMTRDSTGKFHFFSIQSEVETLYLYRSKHSILPLLTGATLSFSQRELLTSCLMEPKDGYRFIWDNPGHELYPVFKLLADLLYGRAELEAMKDKYVGRTLD